METTTWMSLENAIPSRGEGRKSTKGHMLRNLIYTNCSKLANLWSQEVESDHLGCDWGVGVKGGEWRVLLMSVRVCFFFLIF